MKGDSESTETGCNARKLTCDDAAMPMPMGRCNVLASYVIILATLLIPVADAVYHGLHRQPVIAMETPLTLTTSPTPSNEHLLCEYHDPYECKIHPITCNQTQRRCPPISEYSRSHCYVLWNMSAGGVSRVIKKGCWTSSAECFEHEACVDKQEKPEHYFCCCVGDLCNRRFEHRPEITVHTTEVSRPRPVPRHDTLLMTIVYSIVPIVMIAVIVSTVFWLWRNRASRYRHAATHEPELGICVDTESQDIEAAPLLPIQLLELKARGRFGCVWKAQMGTTNSGVSRFVAVKVFPTHDRQSWAVERDFYSMPMVSLQPTILQFIAAELRDEGPSTDLWLITQYHERGSLHDYLKSDLLSWPQLLTVAQSVVQGLTFLHESGPKKLAVAHRDVKSKNVLVKADLTACIADFGLAICFEAGKSIEHVHSQVGTRRYMAPEVLEGAINFTQESFLRIDMYACGLLLWELTSRCSAVDGPVDEYQLPFEDEVSLHPSLEDMTELVVHKRFRPQIKDHWLKNTAMRLFCETIEECWDQDPEARRTAGCVKEQVAQMITTKTGDVSTTIDQQVVLLPPLAKEPGVGRC